MPIFSGRNLDEEGDEGKEGGKERGARVSYPDFLVSSVMEPMQVDLMPSSRAASLMPSEENENNPEAAERYKSHSRPLDLRNTYLVLFPCLHT